MAVGTQRAHLPQDRIIIHGSLDILGSFPDESLQGLHRTQQASRTQSSSATLGALDNVSRGAVDLPSWPSRAITSPDSRTAVSTCFSTGAIDLTVAWGRVGEAGLEHQPRMSATQRDIFNDTARLIQEYRGELLLRRDSAGMAVVARRNPSGTDEGGAVMRPGKAGMDNSEEDKHGYCHMPERTSVGHQETWQSDASVYAKQPSVTWSFGPSAVRHILPQGCYDIGAVDRAPSGYDTAFHGDGNPIGFNENSREVRSPDTRSRNDEQRCWKGPEWYHRRPENSNGNDDGYRCQMDRDDDGLPFDPRESYRGYSGEAEIHRGRLAKGPKLRQYCRRSTELSPGRRCCDLQEVMVAHCCAGRRPHRRNISDERDCVDTRHDSSRGKEERDIPSTRRDWSPEERTLAIPTGRRLWTRGDEEDKKKPRPQILNEALVQRPSDMLLFSKKARPVEYKPCTLKEYRESKPTAYIELGKLQPDLHTEELLAKRANAERVKEFSEKLRQINSEATARWKKSHTAPTKPAVQDARSRALAFARQIPPPRPTKVKPLAKGREGDKLQTNFERDCR